MKKLSANKLAKLLIEKRIQRAVYGFQIPMLIIPKLYRELEAAVAAGKSDDELVAAVAAFPGVLKGAA